LRIVSAAARAPSRSACSRPFLSPRPVSRYASPPFLKLRAIPKPASPATTSFRHGSSLTFFTAHLFAAAGRAISRHEEMM